METATFRDLRHAILTACGHRCHYCGTTAHQIHATGDDTWVGMCKSCLRMIGYQTFPTEEAKTAFLSDHAPLCPDNDMTLLRHTLKKDNIPHQH